MSESKRDPLDEAFAALPRDVTPDRDLWPQIRAEIAGDVRPRRTGLQSRWLQLAAGILLILGTAFTTYFVMRDSMQQQIARNAPQTLPTPAVTAQPASFDFARQPLGAEYQKAHADLDKLFKERIAALPPAARAKVERNLADIRHAAEEISATLAEHPSDPLLQDLLMSTYQSELQLLADVSALPPAGSMRTDL